MDFSERYRVVSARDPRFDGQFVMAVRTTGIYCRPSCPARTPKPGNVEFFPTSAAAHLAGYRACKRCLPEAVPGSPEWKLRETVAARAMRLIADGVVDREGVSGLAARLGYSERQLGRILIAELGAGPLALARAHRAQNARQLIVSTELAMSQVAFAAGFASVRQFNDTIVEVFGMAPSELRVRGRARERAAADGGLAAAGGGLAAGETATSAAPTTVRVVLPYRPPLDAAGVLRWLDARSADGLEAVELGEAGGADAVRTTVAPRMGYSRSLRLPGGAAVVEVDVEGGAPGEPAPRLTGRLRVESLSDLSTALARVRRLFDLDADPLGIDAALSADARIAPLVREIPGIRMPGFLDLHEALVRAILGQQVTVASARTQLRRIVEEIGAPLPEGFGNVNGVERLFPSPERLAEHVTRLVRGPESRRATLVRVCESLAAGELPLDFATPKEEFSAELQRLKGVGPWTADYVAMRFLGAPDVFLPGDVALRKGARLAGLGSETARVVEEAAGFAPWRSYLSLQLWRLAARSG